MPGDAEQGVCLPAISLVAEVRELIAFCTISETQRKDGIGLDRHSLGLVNFLPEELAAHL